MMFFAFYAFFRGELFLTSYKIWKKGRIFFGCSDDKDFA